MSSYPPYFPLQLMALVASTLLDLVKNLRAFAGILVVSDNAVFQLANPDLPFIFLDRIGPVCQRNPNYGQTHKHTCCPT